jgi:hypothetical protein
MNVEKQKKKVVNKLEKLGRNTQLWVIKKSLHGMNREQLEGVIGVCGNYDKPEDAESKKIIMDEIKEIFKKKNYEWIY